MRAVTPSVGAGEEPIEPYRRSSPEPHALAAAEPLTISNRSSNRYEEQVAQTYALTEHFLEFYCLRSAWPFLRSVRS